MRVFFASRILKERCSVAHAGTIAWGSHATIVHRRLAQLQAVPTLAAMMQFPPRLRPSSRSAAHPDEFVLPVVAPFQIIFAAVGEDGARLDGARFKPEHITSALILSIEKRHGA